MAVDVDPQVLFDLLTDPHSLSASLRMIGHEEVSFNVQQFVQVLHKMGVKLGALIVDNPRRDAMLSEDLILAHLGHSSRGDHHVGRNCMYMLCEAINKHTHSIVSIRFWKLSDQIDAYYLPWL